MPATRARAVLRGHDDAGGVCVDWAHAGGEPTSGNWSSLDERLAGGSGMGGARFTASNGVSFKAPSGAAGRGLHVLRAFPAGRALCTLPGRVVSGMVRPVSPHFVWPVRKPQNGMPGRWLVLDPPSCAYPGNLANTSNGSDGGNNAKLVYKPNSSFLTIKTTRALAAMEQVLVAYGAGLTRKVRKEAKAAEAKAALERAQRVPPVHPFATVACPMCDEPMQHKLLRKHCATYACPKRRPTA